MADDIDRGIALLRQAARSKPDDPEICMNLMAGLCRKERPRDAVSEFVSFVKRCPDATQLHHDMLLKLCRVQGWTNPVFQGLQEAAKQTTDPDEFLVHYSLGLFYACLSGRTESFSSFRA